MSKPANILYCHCACADVVPDEVKNEVLRGLADSGVSFEAVADLCELSARHDPALQRIAEAGTVKIAACYPRAVRWLFAAGGAPLAEEGVEILNMKEQEADEIVRSLVGDVLGRPAEADQGSAPKWAPGAWVPWFPVIDYDRCTNCMQCLNFCLFGVYGVSTDGLIEVQEPAKCKTNCPACARICPEIAIIFPKYKTGPINGDEIRQEDLDREKVTVDPSALVSGDVYAALRQRTKQASSAPADEIDEQRALEERKQCACASELAEALDIPSDVLMSLPVMGQPQAGTQHVQGPAEADKKRSAPPSSSSGSPKP